MANKPIVNSPFSDRISKDVPKKGSAGDYDSNKNLPDGIPSRTPSDDGVPEKYFDKAIGSGTPGVGGPIKTLFKDAAGKK
jgi:hypothetical protein